MISPVTLDEWIANVETRRTRVGIIGLGIGGHCIPVDPFYRLARPPLQPPHALVAASKLFIDTRNATRGLTSPNIVRC